MTEPPPLIEPRRFSPAFILILVFIGSLTVMALIGERDEAKRSFPTEVRQAELALKTLSGARGAAQTIQAQRSVESSMRDLKAKVAPLSNRNPEASKLLAIAKTELGEPVKPADLAGLRSSLEPEDAPILKVYQTSGPIENETARELAGAIDGNSFAAKMARVHAYEKAGDEDALQGEFPPNDLAQMFVLGGLFIVILVAGYILIVTYVALRMNGRLKPLGLPAPVLTFVEGERRQLLFIGYWLVAMIAPILLAGMSPGTASRTVAMIVLNVAIVAAFVLWGIPWLRPGLSLGKFIGDRKPTGVLIGWGLAGAISNFPVILLLSLATRALAPYFPEPSHPATEEMLRDPSFGKLMIIFFLAVVVAPIAEELTFRGLLFPSIVRFTGKVWVGVVLSSLFFAMIHPQGVLGWPALAWVGSTAAILSYQTRSLIPSIVMHATHNFFVLLLARSL